MKKIIYWKLFFILPVACVNASFLVLPYTITIASNDIVFTPFIIIAQTAQSVIMFGIAVFFGLLLSKSIGFGLPILQGFLEGKNQIKELKSILPLSGFFLRRYCGRSIIKIICCFFICADYYEKTVL